MLLNLHPKYFKYIIILNYIIIIIYNNNKILCIIVIIGVVFWVSLALLEEHIGDSMAKLSHSSKRERETASE